MGGGGAQAPLTSPCPPSNHTITINLTLTFAASWFGHASHVDWAEQDPQISFMQVGGGMRSPGLAKNAGKCRKNAENAAKNAMENAVP